MRKKYRFISSKIEKMYEYGDSNSSTSNKEQGIEKTHKANIGE